VTQICIKSFIGWGFAPDQLGELTALPRPPSWFMGGPPGKEKEEGGKGGRVGRDGEGEGGERVPECPNSELASLDETNEFCPSGRSTKWVS